MIQLKYTLTFLSRLSFSAELSLKDESQLKRYVSVERHRKLSKLNIKH